MKNTRDDRNTATSHRSTPAYASTISHIPVPLAIVPNNHRPILGTMSEAETVCLGGMLDKLEALEEAVRVRPNAKAIAALRELVETGASLRGIDDDADMANEATAILLEMLDKIMAVPA